MKFCGEVALVTGAGSGIGRATAEAFAREGAAVVLVARHPEEIGDVAERVIANGGQAMAIKADITDKQSLEAMTRRALENFKRVDMLVTCAAAGPIAGPSEDVAMDDWLKVINIDLTGTFLTCQTVGRIMLQQGYGRIVNLTSFHVIATYPERAAYVAAKGGVEGFSKVLAVEWAGRGITVNTVAPGPIRTPRTIWFLSKDIANEHGMVGRTPNGRIGEVDDVASLILFLCSKEAGHINGQTIVIDGGWTKNAWWGQHPWMG